VVGVGMPGHFVVRFEPKGGPNQLIDVYDGGRLITEKDAARKVEAITGKPSRPGDLDAVSKKAIIIRLLHNLLGAAQGEKDKSGMLRYLDGILAIDADAHRDRMLRAVLRYQ